jgi:NAD(P)-dependent dehydrogenase (short-subunit alcohol dehydrogenase family)
VAIPGDLTDEAFCAAAVEQAVRELGGLDILVNNAGKQTTQEDIEDISTEQFDRTLKTNLYALFWVTKAAKPHLKPGAAIINTTSIQAVDPSPGLLDYATTKAGILAFTKALSQQMMQYGVRVNGVAPGPFWTALQPSGGQTQEKVQHFGEKTPYGRPGQPVEIAPVYVFLASQEASYVTGEIYGVTGGEGIV